MDIYVLTNNGVPELGAVKDLAPLCETAAKLGYPTNYQTVYSQIEKKGRFVASFDMLYNTESEGVPSQIRTTIRIVIKKITV